MIESWKPFGPLARHIHDAGGCVVVVGSFSPSKGGGTEAAKEVRISHTDRACGHDPTNGY